MLLWLSGRCAHLWIDWQGPQHPGDLGDEYSFLIGRMVLPDQFAHPIQAHRRRALATRPVSDWLASWLALDTGQRTGSANKQLSRTISTCPGMISCSPPHPAVF